MPGTGLTALFLAAPALRELFDLGMPFASPAAVHTRSQDNNLSSVDKQTLNRIIHDLSAIMLHLKGFTDADADATPWMRGFRLNPSSGLGDGVLLQHSFLTDPAWCY